LLKAEMTLHFVEQMDEVLQIALEEKLTALEEETGATLAAVMPPVLPVPQPVAHQ
jgi:ATP-dependent Lon protease